MKIQHKERIAKYCLPLSIALAISIGIFAFPNILGNYSPFVSLMLIYTFDNWSAVYTMNYVIMFGMIQFFIIVSILSIIILKITYRHSKIQWYSSLFLLISMLVFVLIIVLLSIWIFTGLFDQLVAIYFEPQIPPLQLFFVYSIAYALPALMLAFAVTSLILWLIYYIPTKRLPIKKHRFNYNVFKSSKIPWSGKDKQLKAICWIGIAVAIIEIIFSVYSFMKASGDSVFLYMWQKIWFGVMHHFTELSNLWVAIFFVIILFNYKFKFLKTGSLVTMTFTYISVTFLIADFLLAPFIILNHSSGSINMGFGGPTHWWDLIKTFLFHVLQPIVVLIFFIFFCKSNRRYKPWKFSKIVPITMIFPILYLIYAVTINYLPIEHYQLMSDGNKVIIKGGISVYGYFTCINPDVHANVFNKATPPEPIWQGNIKNLLWFGVGTALFITLAFYYNWIERHTMALRYLRKRNPYNVNYHLHWN